MTDYPLIQGIEPDSWNEVYFARALEKYDVPYRFQVPIIQKPGLRGNITVDFVVYAPFPQPVEIYGRHWHRDDPEDHLKLILTRDRFGREPLVVWDDEIPDQEAADSYVKEHFA